MMWGRYRQSLELIILAPVVVFIVLAGAGLYLLILNSVEEFAERTIRQSSQSMSDAVRSIADRRVDQLSRADQTGDDKATRIRQVSALIEIEDFARKNQVGIVIYAADNSDAVLVSGLPEHVTNIVTKASDFRHRKISLFGNHRYFADTFDFVPWSWRITLLKDATVYESLLLKARYFYVAAGFALLLIAIFLVIYLRGMIARPIHLIVDHFREGHRPDYKGIREFEFLSDSIGKMMEEVSETHEHLEELVHKRTAELEKAKDETEASSGIIMQKNQMLEALSVQLSKYLSPQVYASIFSGRQRVELTSKRKKMTVFFSDIVGFTMATDKMESEDLTELLNHYLTEMSEVALRYGATIDKYVGDAIMIFFGDPETRGIKEDALACVEMAIAMQQRLRELNNSWNNTGIEMPLTCRIGIHTGFCTVGNFGSEDRMDYTIIGGTVNQASRLEGAAQPGTILVSYETYALIKDNVYCEEIGQIQVPGIAYPVATYQVIDLYENLTADERPVHLHLPHLTLDLNPSHIPEDERGEATEALRHALAVLGQNAAANEADIVGSTRRRTTDASRPEGKLSAEKDQERLAADPAVAKKLRLILDPDQR